MEKVSSPPFRSNWKVMSRRSFLRPMATGNLPWSESIWVMERAIEITRSANWVVGAGSWYFHFASTAKVIFPSLARWMDIFLAFSLTP